MADRSQWKSMSGSSRFGIYRESPGKHRRTTGGRFCCSVAIFLVITTVICLTALSITTGKGRKRVKVASDRIPENGKILVNSTGKAVIIEPITTPASAYNATEVGHNQEPSEPSMPRPEVVLPSKLKFPEDDRQEEHSTLVNTPDDRDLSKEDTSFASRQGRIMNEPAVSPYKMRSPPRFLNPPASSNQRPNVLVFSTVESGDYTGNFAQMGPYNNRYDAVKNSQEILDYAADDRPIPIFPQSPTIKFTGVYVRGPAEDIESISLDSKKQLNGHAYSAATDPFRAYKPAHPAEINHLATTSSELDTGIRFSNKIVRATTTAAPSDIHADMGTSGSGTLTQAIFHPYESSVMTSHPGAPPPSSASSSSTRDKKSRPLKIMLDIYPVHQSDMLEQGSVQVVEGERHRKPVAVRPALTLPPVAPPPPVPPPTQPSRMIVHLNLFPKKSQKNSSQRRTTLPTAMTLIPGGGAHFQDRNFDSLERPVTSHVSFPLRRSSGGHNDSVPDESIEIAERYPVPAADGLMDRNSRATFMMSDDQVMEHSAPYSFVIGRARSRGDHDRDDDQDDGGGEGGVFIMEDMEELHGRGSRDEELGHEESDRSHEDTEQSHEDTEQSHEDTEGSREGTGGSDGERVAFHEEEDTGNGYKVVSFQVSGDMMDGVDEEVINEGGILRAAVKPEDSRGTISEGGGSTYRLEETHKPIRVGEKHNYRPDDSHGLISTGQRSKYGPEEAYGIISSGQGSKDMLRDTHGGQNNHGYDPASQVGKKSVNAADKGIRIKKINPPRFFPQPSQLEAAHHDLALHDVIYDDDKLPIGTVSEMGTSELDGVPGYNEGSIIEPRADTFKSNWWPRSEMLKSNGSLASTTGLPILFPTGSTLPSQTTEDILSVTEHSTKHM